MGFNVKIRFRIGAALAAFLILLAPALWNGFPLLQYDTGGYIARWYEGTLEVSRSTVYGLFLNALTIPDFWPAILVQAALTVWILSLASRLHGLATHAVIIVIAALSVLTALPFIVDVLLTDIFAGLAVLALYMLLRFPDTLGAWERHALFLFIAFSSATHSATLLVLLAMLAMALVVALFDRRLVALVQIVHGVAAILLGATMLIAANYAVAGRVSWTPGGVGILFGRMLQAGIATRYLDEHCPDTRFKLCDHLGELPASADEFFWGASVFDRLGRFDGLNDEMRTIVLESLIQYPRLQIQAAISATLEQLLLAATGYGIQADIWHTHGMIETFVPAALPAMRAARQFKGKFNFAAINRIHLPVAWGSLVLLVAVIGLGVTRSRFADLGQLAGAIGLALLANAFACGALSNPHDRYGSRMAWLATLVVLFAVLRAWRQQQSLPSNASTNLAGRVETA
jgi:hypothetical protein